MMIDKNDKDGIIEFLDSRLKAILSIARSNDDIEQEIILKIEDLAQKTLNDVTF